MELFLDLDWEIWRSTHIIGSDICSDKDYEDLSFNQNLGISI